MLRKRIGRIRCIFDIAPKLHLRVGVDFETAGKQFMTRTRFANKFVMIVVSLFELCTLDNKLRCRQTDETVLTFASVRSGIG